MILIGWPMIELSDFSWPGDYVVWDVESKSGNRMSGSAK